MLKLRLITAAVLIPLVLAVLFYLSSPWVALLFGVFIAAGAWEWSNLMGLRSVGERFAYAIALVAAGVALLILGGALMTTVFAVAAAGWVVVLIEIVRRPVVHDGWFTGRSVRGVIGFLVLIPAWLAAYSLHALDPERPYTLLFALVVVWVADSMAYFSGHFFGRTKLAVAISPGKTVEGVIGGVASVALVAAVAGALLWRLGDARLAGWIALSVIAALFSVLGDLLESKFKRLVGVKDSGQLLPGHGGALDRIDALTAALPIFALGWQLWFQPI